MKNEKLLVAVILGTDRKGSKSGLVSPEYNHSFSGSFKTLIDTEYDNYFHKPVALAGVSSGPWGGIRAVESLVPAQGDRFGGFEKRYIFS